MEEKMRFAKSIPIVLALLLLAACGDKNENKDAPKLFEGQRALLDKAKNEGNTLQQQADEQKKALDQQSE
jgi:hypothetical protein